MEEVRNEPHLVTRALNRGKGQVLMEAMRRGFRNQPDANVLGVIQADSVHTPAKRHLQWGVDQGCASGGDTHGDWVHYIWRCPRTRRPEGVSAMPRCLEHAGNVLR